MRFNPKSKLDSSGFMSPAQSIHKLNARDEIRDLKKQALSRALKNRKSGRYAKEAV